MLFNNTVVGGRFDPAAPLALQGYAYDPAHGTVYIGDSAGNFIYALNASTATGLWAAGTTPNPYGYFADPVALVYDGARNAVFVANEANGNVGVLNGTNGRLQETLGSGCGPEGVALDSVGQRLYVANFCSANVTVLNVTSNTSVATEIPVGANPSAVLWDPFNSQLFVACVGSEEVLAWNVSTGELAHQFLIGGSPSANVGPVALALDTRNGFVFVANSGADNVSVIDGRDDSFAGPGVALPDSPLSVAYDPASGQAYVGLVSAGVAVFNDSQVSGNASVSLPGSLVYSIGYDSADSRIYLVDQGSDAISVVDARTGGLLPGGPTFAANMLGGAFDPGRGDVLFATPDLGFTCSAPGRILDVTGGPRPSYSGSVQVGYGPESVLVGGISGRVFVPDSCSDHVSVLDGNSLTIDPTTVPTGAWPNSAAEVGPANQVAVANSLSGNLTVFNESSLAVVYPNVSVGTNPYALAYAGTSNRVFVANYGSANVSVIDPSGWRSATYGVNVGSFPEAIIFDPASNQVFVANAGSDSVTVLNASTGNVTAAAIPVGSGPVAMALDSAADTVYVADAGSGSVSIIGAANDSLLASGIRVGPNPHGVVYDPVDNSVLVSDSTEAGIFVLANPPSLTRFNATVNPVEPGVVTILTSQVENGTAPFTYNYSGLPSGCQSVDSPVLTCAPQASGTYNISAEVTDAFGYRATASVSLLVSARPTGSLALNAAQVEVGEEVTLTASFVGGVGPIEYQYLGLPAGCSSANAPSLSCVPESAGDYQLWVTANDTLGVRALATAPLSVVERPGVAAFFPSAQEVAVGANLTFRASEGGGIGPITWSYSGLPPGCLSSNSSVLSCVPTAPGFFSPEVTARDSHGFEARMQANVTVVAVITQPLEVVLFLADPSSVDLGGSTSFLLITSGGQDPLNELYAGLPDGCATRDTTTLVCTPSSPGSFSVEVVVTDAHGATVNASAALIVQSHNASTPVWQYELGAGALGALATGTGAAVAWIIRRRNRSHR